MGIEGLPLVAGVIYPEINVVIVCGEAGNAESRHAPAEFNHSAQCCMHGFPAKGKLAQYQRIQDLCHLRQ